MRVALSNSATGVFTNDGNLYETLRNAGTVTGDRVWRFPLWQHFTDEVTSERFKEFMHALRYLFYNPILETFFHSLLSPGHCPVIKCSDNFQKKSKVLI